MDFCRDSLHIQYFWELTDVHGISDTVVQCLAPHIGLSSSDQNGGESLTSTQIKRLAQGGKKDQAAAIIGLVSSFKKDLNQQSKSFDIQALEMKICDNKELLFQ